MTVLEKYGGRNAERANRGLQILEMLNFLAGCIGAYFIDILHDTHTDLYLQNIL